MRPPIDIAGQRFGRLVVIGPAHVDRFGYQNWHCVCDCSQLATVRGSSLRSGRTRSCGCLKREHSDRQDQARRKARPSCAVSHMMAD